jgi:hypothetical protein
MGLFGSKNERAPLPLDVLTTEYLISGQVEPDNQEWTWAYFSPHEKEPTVALELSVTATRSTGARPAPALTGTSASFAYSTALIAVIARGVPADALWDEWAAGGMGPPLAGELLVGPYSVSGTFLTVDGTMAAVLNDRIAVRDATFTRVDGAGDGSPIAASRAVVATNQLHAAAVAGPLIQ